MRSPDIKLSARSWSVCPPTSIPLVSASVAPHAKSLQCHELTERALHEERGNAFYPRLAIAASPPADGKHPRKNWPRQTSFSRSMDHTSLRFRHHKKSPGLNRIPPVRGVQTILTRKKLSQNPRFFVEPPRPMGGKAGTGLGLVKKLISGPVEAWI